jgi:D-alanyl-D-alanine carboxypeptidase/D-alanyl-D-alanine-endopeptidase (penicillin-binding protein 4)
MKNSLKWTIFFLITACTSLQAADTPLPNDMEKIMRQEKYKHSIWGLYVKDLQTGKVLYDVNSEKLFSPASTSKLFSVAALLNTFGDDYRFKTPVYAAGSIKGGQLQGNLIVVASGDLTMGGRQTSGDKSAFTKLDHINANEVPGVILTKENPLNGFIDLAKQVNQSGIKEIHGDIIIDDRLFETTEKRDMVLSPMILNENLIDIVINPSSTDQKATLTWRPEVPGYSVDNQVKTVGKDGPLAFDITSDPQGHRIVVKGTIPLGQKDVVRTFSIKDPNRFARAAFIQALQNQGVKVFAPQDPTPLNPSTSYKDLKQVALWTSPPLSEYAKLILKVSHNLGANLIPLLLASHQGKKTFDDGMRLIGDFIVQDVKISPTSFVFADAAGGNENRLTPKAEVQLLEFMHKETALQFQRYFDALPILGKDGSLEDFAKDAPAAGKVRAKPGTGVAFNLATNKFFLITQALGGYVEGKDGDLYAYMLAVNNATMPTIQDIFPIFEDVSQISNVIYNYTGIE